MSDQMNSLPREDNALSVRDLTVSFRTNKGIVHAVRGISFDLKKGETLALVGESGSGKSVTAKAMLGIEAPNAIIEKGSIFYEGRDLLKFTEEDFNQIRGNKITMIFQDPMSSLDPIVKIGPQMTEAAILNGKRNQKLAEKRLSLLVKNFSKNGAAKSGDAKSAVSKNDLAAIKKAVKLAKKDYSIQLKNISSAYDFEEAKPKLKIPECLSPVKNILSEKEFDELNDALCRSAFCVTKKMAYEKALKIMEEVGISDGKKRFNQYPFEFSGGMRQRIVIAIAIAANPDLLICDEPTTALDVTIQAQILELINSLKKKRGMSVIFITHDLGVVANVADRIAVMYAGKIVETGSVDDIFYNPAHPYTWALLASMPDLDSSGRLEAIPGTPPNMIYPPEGDAFAERNKYAMQIDFEREPPLFRISDSHFAATWLLHPNAPKVELPESLAKRIARMKERRSADGGKK